MKVYRGNFVCAPEFGTLSVLPRGYLAVDADGTIAYAGRELPEAYAPCEQEDFGEALVLPGFVDLHFHAAQPAIMGLGHESGEDWFSEFCYPAEHAYGEAETAEKTNAYVVSSLRRFGITRSFIMGTTAVGPLKDLAERLSRAGLSARIGKMNSDQGAFGKAQETTAASREETLLFLDFLQEVQKQNPLIGPALCPEFAPACTAELMAFLGDLSRTRGIPIHTHMAEGAFDVKLVREQFPEQKTYGRVYDAFGLLSGAGTVLAHCLSCTEEEIGLLAERGAVVAHCPVAALDSGARNFFPLRKFVRAGVKVGLGSDVGGGHTFNMMRTMTAAIHTSKLFAEETPLNASEALYLATKSGGALFGKVGSFEKGYAFDALVIDDQERCALAKLDLSARLTQFIYTADPAEIKRCFCQGREIETKEGGL